MTQELEIYNSLGRTVEEFESLEEDRVRMYVCGVTVYDDCHVGHGRVYVTFDVVRRFLEYEGYDVKYVVNFTDVDDKIIERAEDVGTTPRELSRTYTKSYFDVMDRLNIRRADVHPTVTGHIEEIIDFVEDLLDEDMAYEVDGDIYFDVEKFEDYGKLSGQDPDEMKEGARVDVDERKKSPLDFALWKSAEEEPCWESPWGDGRPGWHIECSVMSSTHFEEKDDLEATLDIHGGGRDLIFPHHENEVAQSEARTGKQFSRYWMHNGFVTIDDEKMSKSEGNFYTLKEIFNDEGFDPRVVRYFYLTRQYRSPLNFSFDRLEEARKALDRLEDFLDRLKEAESWSSGRAEQHDLNVPPTGQERESFLEYMRSDFNTPAAIAQLQDWARDWNPILDAFERKDALLHQTEHNEITRARAWLETALREILGIAPPDRSEGESGSEGPIEGLLDELVELREQAREDENYEMADRIRDRLQDLGYRIEDRPKGTEWERVRDQ